MTEASTFWDRIEQLTSGSYSRKQLATDCGIAVNTIAMWKSRRNYPAADIAVKVAKALHTTVEFLITGKDKNTDPWIIENSDFIQQCKLLTDAQLSVVKDLVYVQISPKYSSDIKNIQMVADVTPKYRKKETS